jgi:anti-sigma factor ChrR (cupin superfamily)
MDDQFGDSAEAYAIGVLDPGEREPFEAHLVDCSQCRREVERHGGTLGLLPRSLPPKAPRPSVREQLMDLSEAPSLPIDVARYDWAEVVPGVKVHLLKEDAARGMRTCLVWAMPGAKHPRHRHLGDENILVLQGALKDERDRYEPGQICRSRQGSIHSEEVASEEQCLCFVVYYGELEMLEGE